MSKPDYLQGSLQLQERDRRILEFIHRFRVATSPQIERMFFKDASSNPGYQRLRKLQNEGYLKIYNLRAVNQIIYQISIKGVQVIGAQDDELLKKGDAQRIYNSQIEHDLGLTDIAISFLSLPHQIIYKSENEIRGSGDHKYDEFIPDALLTFNEGLPISIAIEYERTFKKAKLYHEKFYRMGKYGKKYHRYLYVLDDLKKRSFFEKLISESEYLTEQNFLSRILFVSLEELIKAPYDCPIQTSLGNHFRMRDLFEKTRKEHLKILTHIPLIIKEPKNWGFLSTIEDDLSF